MGTKKAKDPTRSPALSFHLPWGLWSLPSLHPSQYEAGNPYGGSKSFEVFPEGALGKKSLGWDLRNPGSG